MTTLDPTILEQAKGFLHDKGWGQGALVCDNGKVCALGALHLALGSTVTTRTEVEDGLERTYFGIDYPYGETPLAPLYEGPKYGEPGYNEAVTAWNERYNEHYNGGEYAAWRERQTEYVNRATPYEILLNDVVMGLTNDEITWVADWNDLRAEDVTDIERVFDLAIERINEKELVSV